MANGGEETVRVSDGEHVVSNVHKPSVTPYLPSKESATGMAIVIAPGGAHRELWVDKEGYNVAQRLSEHGIAGFVLKYRLAKAPNSTYTVERDSVNDMQRAIRVIRSRAAEWGIHSDKIGVMGFSAGGQVAALTDVQPTAGHPDATDPIDTLSSKPNFQVLIYAAWVNDVPITKESAPAFIACGFQDMDSISSGMPQVFLKFKKANVPAELHIYAEARHGFGVRKDNTAPSGEWPTAMVAWLNEMNKKPAK
jgi:endo-1,4-beta-xylanase